MPLGGFEGFSYRSVGVLRSVARVRPALMPRCVSGRLTAVARLRWGRCPFRLLFLFCLITL
ncbi:MAG: hypothetical protein HG464_004190 [Bacteroidia bacterium]|nr:hypothetical protein [Bacteroidia bacterium]